MDIYLKPKIWATHPTWSWWQWLSLLFLLALTEMKDMTFRSTLYCPLYSADVALHLCMAANSALLRAFCCTCKCVNKKNYLFTSMSGSSCNTQKLKKHDLHFPVCLAKIIIWHVVFFFGWGGFGFKTWADTQQAIQKWMLILWQH